MLCADAADISFAFDERATAKAEHLPAGTPPSQSPDLRGATAHDLDRALLRATGKQKGPKTA